MQVKDEIKLLIANKRTYIQECLKSHHAINLRTFLEQECEKKNLCTSHLQIVYSRAVWDDKLRSVWMFSRAGHNCQTTSPPREWLGISDTNVFDLGVTLKNSNTSGKKMVDAHFYSARFAVDLAIQPRLASVSLGKSKSSYTSPVCFSFIFDVFALLFSL